MRANSVGLSTPEGTRSAVPWPRRPHRGRLSAAILATTFGSGQDRLKELLSESLDAEFCQCFLVQPDDLITLPGDDEFVPEALQQEHALVFELHGLRRTRDL